MAQTYVELQSNIEEARLEIYNNHISKIEVYSFKRNKKDSTLFSYSIYDSLGNITEARQYNYKKRKYYSEQFFQYDSLGRRIELEQKSTFLDKANKSKIKCIEKYEYDDSVLIKRFVECRGDNPTTIQTISEHKRIEPKYLNKKTDSLNRIILAEYHSAAGREKIQNSYHSNGNLSSQICHIDDRLWYKSYYDSEGNGTEHIEWLYYNKSTKPNSHSRSYYNDSNLIIRKENLDEKGNISSHTKYFYY